MRAPGGSCKHLGILGGSFGSLGAPFGFILAFLGRLLDPFWLSWDVLGRLGTPFLPKLAQVGPSWPKIAKKNRFFEFDLRIWDQVGTQVGTQVGPRPSKIEARTPKNQG